MPISEHSNAELEKLRAALVASKEKLALYRQRSSGEYIGGVEYSALVWQIDDALAHR